MKSTTLKAATLAAILFAGSAHAEFLSGNDLLSRLSSENLYDRGVATGYIMGVHDAGYGVAHCPAPGVTFGQISDMVRQHLIAVPAVRHLSADSHVTYVLSKQWPCQTQKKSGGQTL